MARFDFYPVPGSKNGEYFLDVQADILSSLKTRIVIPLVPAKSRPKVKEGRLNPMFEIEGESYLALTQTLSVIDKNELKIKAGSMEQKHHVITDALDFLFQGF